MTVSSPWIVFGLLATWPVVAASRSSPLDFEEVAQRSDRIAVGTMLGASGGSVKTPEGAEIALGIKDAASGLVFTPYRVRISLCLFDAAESCRPGDSEVFVPGGTVYETVDGELQLRTWEVSGAAGVPLPPAGGEVLLFMTRRNGRYLPLNDRGARIPVVRSSGPASVELHFASPRFLSPEARDAARARVATDAPEATPPEFVESVPLDRLTALIVLARQVPKPTSGTRHAIPDRADLYASGGHREPYTRVRPGDDPQRREAPLGNRGDLDPIYRADDRRWELGP